VCVITDRLGPAVIAPLSFRGAFVTKTNKKSDDHFPLTHSHITFTKNGSVFCFISAIDIFSMNKVDYYNTSTH